MHERDGQLNGAMRCRNVAIAVCCCFVVLWVAEWLHLPSSLQSQVDGRVAEHRRELIVMKSALQITADVEERVRRAIDDGGGGEQNLYFGDLLQGLLRFICTLSVAADSAAGSCAFASTCTRKVASSQKRLPVHALEHFFGSSWNSKSMARRFCI